MRELNKDSSTKGIEIYKLCATSDTMQRQIWDALLARRNIRKPANLAKKVKNSLEPWRRWWKPELEIRWRVEDLEQYP